ncbi:MAG: hypothetical protein DME25_14915 [Verrucomicrobia bacterium]|nr:MAG: hypothetical protein DME25_14915 [Verrucomicrobiota bacterium]
MKNPDDLLKSSPSLPLSAINDATPEGQQLIASAGHILATLKKSADAITLEDTTKVTEKLGETTFNGDGIIVEDSAPDDNLKVAIRDIIACLGPETDRSGRPGISQAKLDQFFVEAQLYSDWWKKTVSDPAVLPLGEGTAAAAAAVKAIKAKADDYLARCRLAEFDPRALTALNREEKEYLAFAGKELTLASAEIAALPLARIEPGRPLPLKQGANPAWTGALASLHADAVKPLLGDKPSLTEADWTALLAKLAPYWVWEAAKAGALVERLGLKRVRELLGGDAKARLAALIAQDKKLEPEFAAIAAVERIVRYHRDLFKLCNNFVSFHDFYSRKEKAIFQAGTLYLDQRSCDLCLTVADAAKHAIMAGLSGTYLTYCDCQRKGSGEKMQIVAAFTDGDSDNLMVGRNGIFYDRSGRDWDATITRIVDNPISIRQAFWAPYKKAARMIHEQIAKRAASADTAAVGRLSQAVAKVEAKATAPPPATPPAPEPAKAKVDPGLIAALSVGAAGVGGMIGGIVSGFLNLKGLMPLGVLAILLIISGPSMLLAWLKLRKRNLGPILDANGWAVNAKAKINVPFGASLTRIAALPAGSQRDLVDPFAERRRPWGLYVALVLLVALAVGWWLGKLDRLLPTKLKSITVLGHNAPAYQPPVTSTNGAGSPK